MTGVKTMPSTTYYNLPETKKERILEAAKREFSDNGIAKASINKMIKTAEISRGSFYMYFSDKYDLVSLVIEDFWKLFVGKIFELAKETHGSLNEMILGIFDFIFIQTRNKENCQLIKQVFVYLASEAIDNHEDRILRRLEKEPLTRFIHLLDMDQFASGDTDYVTDTVQVAFAVLHHVVNRTIVGEIEYEEAKQKLKNYLNIIETGYKHEGEKTC